MNRLTLTMLRRSIRGSLGRFLAILAIVALGVGLFAGIKSSQPDLLRSLDSYYRGQHMYDFQLLSSLGFTEEDAAEMKTMLDGIGMPAVNGVPAEIAEIVEEEISVFLGGASSAEDCAKKIQSRAGIWLSEHQ